MLYAKIRNDALRRLTAAILAAVIWTDMFAAVEYEPHREDSIWSTSTGETGVERVDEGFDLTFTKMIANLLL